MRKILHLLLIAVLPALPAALFSACGKPSPYADSNVIIILVDTLRRDRLGIHGNEKGLTGFMDQVARKSVYFRRAVAPSSWTKPSVASLLTGLYPGQHGAVGIVDSLKFFHGRPYLDPKHVTLAERLKEAGYRTAAFVSNVHISPSNHFEQGFDHFENLESEKDSGDGPEVFRKASEWIASDGKEGKFFLYLHLVDPHFPYFPPGKYREQQVKESPGEGTLYTRRGRPDEIEWWLDEYRKWKKEQSGEPFRFDYETFYEERIKPRLPGMRREYQQKFETLERFRSEVFLDFAGLDDPELRRRAGYLTALYDGEVAYTNDALMAFVLHLEERGLLDKTILVVTADHGEAFLEHGEWGHHDFVSPEEIDIPLILRIAGPGGVPLKGAFDEYVSLVDVYPTLLDLLGLDGQDSISGVSLKPLITGEDEKRLSSRPVFSELLRDTWDHVGVIKDGGKLVRTARGWGDVEWRFYDLVKDPGEMHPLPLEAAGAEAANLKKCIDAFLKQRNLEPADEHNLKTLTPEELQELRDLGYL
jgi:arylsulfatase A-like enzyme